MRISLLDILCALTLLGYKSSKTTHKVSTNMIGYALAQLFPEHVILGTIIQETEQETKTTISFNGKSWDYLELPYIGNQNQISRIKRGIYWWKKHQSPTLGDVLYLQNVDNRSWIYLHRGSKRTHTKGCIISPHFRELYDMAPDQGIIALLTNH